MYHTIGYIEGKISDFKICKDCSEINWYENKECHNCGNIYFRKMTKIDVKNLKESFFEEIKRNSDSYELKTG